MIIVFGSINMDLVTRAPRLPAAGQTISGTDFATIPGGKGANQAVACAKLGIPTAMVGRVGDDVFGDALRASLVNYGVDVSAVERSAGPSGVAAIAVDERGENTIVVVPGANGLVGEDDIARLETLLPRAEVLLLQLEVPLEAVLAAARAARAHGVTVILDPAPARELPPEIYPLIDIITPNETEATELVGFLVRDAASAGRAGAALLARGVGAAVIKAGGSGAYLVTRQGMEHLPVFSVVPVDTVAAGDACNGGLAAGLAEGMTLPAALRLGMATAAIAVTRHGAQPGMPSRAEVDALIRAR